MTPFGPGASREDKLELSARRAWGRLKVANAKIRALRGGKLGSDEDDAKPATDSYLDALDKKRAETAEELVKARVGSRSETILRTSLLEYNRLITARRAELSTKEKKQAVAPESPTTPAKPHRHPKRGFSTIF